MRLAVIGYYGPRLAGVEKLANRLDDLSKRQEITRNILRSINALPPS